MKTELILDGLSCANCATLIEQDINKIDGIEAHFNVVTQSLILDIDNQYIPEHFYQKVASIILKHEPHLKIRQNFSIQDNPYQIKVIGIKSYHSINQIENAIRELPEIYSVHIDWFAQQCQFSLTAGTDYQQTIMKMSRVLFQIDRTLKLEYAQKKTSISDLIKTFDATQRIRVIRFIIGTLLLLMGIVNLFPQNIQWIVFLSSYLIIGGSVIFRAISEVSHGKIFSENTLMTIATVGAFIIGEYPEGVAVMLFYLVGEFFQEMAVASSRKSIKSLMLIRPQYANLLINGNIQQVSPEEVAVGDILVIKPGEKIPLDGIIIDGTSSIDTSTLTGEPLFKPIWEGQTALSGTINVEGMLKMKVTKIYQDSTVAKILDLIQHASNKKASTEQFITTFARYYTPAVVLLALAIALLPPLLIPGAQYSIWAYRALVLLVISCPCALVISIPLGYFGGVGLASKNGILVKGSNYLEALNFVDKVVFDKTGTLTKGTFTIANIVSTSEFSSKQILHLAALAESYSTHPIAQSILAAYHAPIDQSVIYDYQEFAGLGVKLHVDTQRILVGNLALMKLFEIVSSFQPSYESTIYIAVNQEIIGYIVLTDELKEDASLAIQQLEKLNIHQSYLLTGDRKDVGDKIGKELGINQVFSQLLPIDKVTILEKIILSSKNHKKTVFVGDGINDAPSLARADIGIAMGNIGSDAAIEAADIVILTDEPIKIATAIKIARKTRTIVFQNIGLALSIKGLFLILGALGLSTMWQAVFADSGVALLAILNAMRLLHAKP